MIIKKIAEPKAVDFQRIQGGECFHFPAEDMVGIRFSWEIEESNGDRWNCIDLATGEPSYIRDYEKVIPLKAEVVINKEV